MPEGGPPQQNANQGQYGAPYAPYGAPPPSQYGAPPPSQYGAPPPHQYGAPSPQYGAHPPQYAPPPQQQPGFDVNTVRNKLESMVVANGLQTFYPPSRLHALAEEVSRKDLAGLARRWRLPTNVAQDLITLALYDIIIFADDSGSMAFKEWNGERIEDLKALLTRIADAATLFDSDGISVRFMNGAAEGNNLATAADVERMMSQIKFGGMTPLGTQLERKVLKPLVLGPAKTGQLRKPVSIIVITDGEPTQESPDTLRTAIKHTKRHLSETKYGPGAVAFQFAQVGRDEEASKFLGKLDTDPKVGGMVDCTSYIELEQQEYQKKGLELTPELYLVKLLCGAIDKSYDSQDEEKKKKKSFLKGLFA